MNDKEAVFSGLSGRVRRGGEFPGKGGPGSEGGKSSKEEELQVVEDWRRGENHKADDQKKVPKKEDVPHRGKPGP